MLKMHKIIQFLRIHLQNIWTISTLNEIGILREYGEKAHSLTRGRIDLYKGKSLESREMKGIYTLDYLRELQ